MHTFLNITSLQKRIFPLLLLLSSFAHGQIHLLRYDDNFEYLKKDSVAQKDFEKLKSIPLSKDVRISFGAELREQYQYYKNQNFGDVANGEINNSRVWHRFMVHSTTEFGNSIRIFTQLGSTFRFFNSAPLTPEIEENRLSLHQAFFEYQFTKEWMMRLGRQQLSYGNHRLLTFREGPNTRLSFDAAILKLNSKKRKIDLLALSPVVSKRGVFDDTSLKEFILGVYATEHLASNKLHMDYYFLDFISENRKYNFVPGKENRQVTGARFFSENPKLNYELEGTYQFGTFDNLSIQAFGVSGDINYTAFSKNRIIVGVGANYASGDKNPGDGYLNTYNLFFSKPQYGLTAPIGATNILTFNPYLKLKNSKTLQLFAGTYFMYRQSISDGSYTPGAIEVRPKSLSEIASNEKEIGKLFTLETNYTISSHLVLSFDASYFTAGRFIKASGKGKDITYVSWKVNFKI